MPCARSEGEADREQTRQTTDAFEDGRKLLGYQTCKYGLSGEIIASTSSNEDLRAARNPSESADPPVKVEPTTNNTAISTSCYEALSDSEEDDISMTDHKQSSSTSQCGYKRLYKHAT